MNTKLATFGPLPIRILAGAALSRMDCRNLPILPALPVFSQASGYPENLRYL